jgi:hypothetical protein
MTQGHTGDDGKGHTAERDRQNSDDEPQPQTALGRTDVERPDLDCHEAEAKAWQRPDHEVHQGAYSHAASEDRADQLKIGGRWHPRDQELDDHHQVHRQHSQDATEHAVGDCSACAELGLGYWRDRRHPVCDPSAREADMNPPILERFQRMPHTGSDQHAETAGGGHYLVTRIREPQAITCLK